MMNSKSIKSQSNFEKVKNEMNRKKIKAEAQNDSGELKEKIINANSVCKTDFEYGVQKEQHIKAKTQNQDEIMQMLVFYVAEEEFAIKISCVKEITRVTDIKKVPNSPHHIAGLCNYRGFLLPVIDSHEWLGIQDTKYDKNSRIIVTDISEKNIGILVDKVSEILSTEIKNISELPESISAVNNGIVTGILSLDNGKRIIMIVDVENRLIRTIEY